MLFWDKLREAFSGNVVEAHSVDSALTTQLRDATMTARKQQTLERQRQAEQRKENRRTEEEKLRLLRPEIQEEEERQQRLIEQIHDNVVSGFKQQMLKAAQRGHNELVFREERLVGVCAQPAEYRGREYEIRDEWEPYIRRLKAEGIRVRVVVDFKSDMMGLRTPYLKMVARW